MSKHHLLLPHGPADTACTIAHSLSTDSPSSSSPTHPAQMHGIFATAHSAQEASPALPAALALAVPIVVAAAALPLPVPAAAGGEHAVH